jgi:proteasome lid subunit RPN8/RPN11
VAPEHQLACSASLWRRGLAELKHRGKGRHESGAFLLGRQQSNRRTVHRFVYYDDLDPHCLDSGIVILEGSVFGQLWRICRETDMSVVADVHTHPDGSYHSITDQENPMLGVAGHIAIVVPNLAMRPVKRNELGIYQYLGNHLWDSYRGKAAAKFFYIGLWS